MYGGEILSAESDIEVRTEITSPRGDSKLRIVEIEHEITEIGSLSINGKERLNSKIFLRRGDKFDLEIQGRDQISIFEKYSAVIKKPRSPTHLRQKFSMLKAAQQELNID